MPGVGVMAMVGRVFLLASIVLFAGCIDVEQGNQGQSAEAEGEQEVAIAGQGQMTGSKSKQVACDGSARISVGIQGQGGVDVTVRDGSGDKVYEKSFDGQGQTADDVSRTGSAGTWQLHVEFSGSTYYPMGFQGQYGIYLRC